LVLGERLLVQTPVEFAECRLIDRYFPCP